MKKLIALLALAAIVSNRTYAGQIVYGFSFPESFNRITGTITTDGTIGDLQLANIIGWTEQVYSGPNLIGHVAPYVPNTTLGLVIQGTLEATSTYISLPPPLTPPIGQETFNTARFSGDNYSLSFDNDVLNSGIYAGNPLSTQQVSSSASATAGGNTFPLYDWSTAAQGENVLFVIATAIATPEPSSLILAILGLAALLAYHWRRYLTTYPRSARAKI